SSRGQPDAQWPMPGGERVECEWRARPASCTARGGRGPGRAESADGSGSVVGRTGAGLRLLLRPRQLRQLMTCRILGLEVRPRDLLGRIGLCNIDVQNLQI